MREELRGHRGKNQLRGSSVFDFLEEVGIQVPPGKAGISNVVER